MNDALQMLELSQIDPSEHNPRRIRKDDPAIAELAKSIEGCGLLQPVVCRPQGDRFELLAGRRRFEAHKLLELGEILAIVRDLDDAQAIEVTVLENLQRENLTPVEESRGVASLVASGHTLDRIADEIGKSRSWVARRASVQRLMPALVDLADEHEWSARRIEMLSRLPAITQKTMLARFDGNHFICDTDCDRNVEREISELTRTLKTMPWRKQDDGMLFPEAGPCDECLMRSSVNPDLFGDGGDEKKTADDTCLNGPCYDRKTAAWADQRERALRQKHPDMVVISSYGSYNMPEASKARKAIAQYDWDRAKSKSEKGARPAVICDGPQAGALAWIRPHRSGSSTNQQQASNPELPAAERLAAKREMLDNRRKAWIIEKVAHALDQSRLSANFVTLSFADNALMLMALATSIGTDTKNNFPSPEHWKSAEVLYKDGGAELLRKLWEQIAEVMLDRLKIYGAQQCQPHYKEAMEVRSLLSLESEDIFQKRAALEIPEPKAWAKLEPEANQTKKGDES